MNKNPYRLAGWSAMIAVCVTVYFIRNGIVAFFIAALVLGVWLRSHRTKENAERFGCVMHFFFFAGMVAPPLVAIVYPGLIRHATPKRLPHVRIGHTQPA